MKLRNVKRNLKKWYFKKKGMKFGGKISWEFRDSNPNWYQDPKNIVSFLRAQENIANDILNCEGFLTLEDVLTLLNVKSSDFYHAEKFVWLDDSYVSFGLPDWDWEPSIKQYEDFLEGKIEGFLVLHFNPNYIL